MIGCTTSVTTNDQESCGWAVSIASVNRDSRVTVGTESVILYPGVDIETENHHRAARPTGERVSKTDCVLCNQRSSLTVSAACIQGGIKGVWELSVISNRNVLSCVVNKPTGSVARGCLMQGSVGDQISMIKGWV